MTFAAVSLSGAAEPKRISLAESPVPGLRERVETHLAQEYDCVVISRSQPVASSQEQSIEQMRAVLALKPPAGSLQAADFCVWASVWDASLFTHGQVPANGIRELSFDLADLTCPVFPQAEMFREKVAERSDYERTLAQRIADKLKLQRLSVRHTTSKKDVALAVLPLVRQEQPEHIPAGRSIPADTTYAQMEAVLQGCLPAGATLLSRDRLREVLAEHHLVGLDDQGGAMRAVAHLLPAQALVCGTVSRRSFKPDELRLDLHLISPQSNTILAAWEGRCADIAALPDIAAAGVRELMAMPWRMVQARKTTDILRQHEAQFMLSHACYDAAWCLAKNDPDLQAPILRGLLKQAVAFFLWRGDPNAETFDRQKLQETSVMLDALIGEQTFLESEKERVPWPALIRAEILFWLGRYNEAERLCRSHLADHPKDLTERAQLILAWSLFKQQRYDESRPLLKQVTDRKGLTWYFPGFSESTGWYWANRLHVELSRTTHDLSGLYARAKRKMFEGEFITEDEMGLYLDEVDKRESPEQTIRELSSILVYGSECNPALMATKPLDMKVSGWFSHLCPAYVVRGRSYERLGQKQRALEDYALFLRIKGYALSEPPPVIDDQKKWQIPYIAEAAKGLFRLRAEGMTLKDQWLSLAQTRSFPADAAIYVVPVGFYDKTTLDLFVKETADFLGARIEVLPALEVPKNLKVINTKSGTPTYDGQALVLAALRQISVPDDVVQLVLASSEVYRMTEGNEFWRSGSFDGGHTLLLSIKGNKFPQGELKRRVPYCLQFRYLPNSKEPWLDEPPNSKYFLMYRDYCSPPCLFGANLKSGHGENMSALCPRCQEDYKKVDFDALKRQTVAALSKQGVKIFPASSRDAAPKASAGH
jgi:tetratricopeptide (TPR) repeat protein